MNEAEFEVLAIQLAKAALPELIRAGRMLFDAIANKSAAADLAAAGVVSVEAGVDAAEDVKFPRSGT